MRQTLSETKLNIYCCGGRGKVVWNNSNIVDIADDMTRHRHEYVAQQSNKQSTVYKQSIV